MPRYPRVFKKRKTIPPQRKRKTVQVISTDASVGSSVKVEPNESLSSACISSASSSAESKLGSCIDQLKSESVLGCEMTMATSESTKIKVEVEFVDDEDDEPEVIPRRVKKQKNGDSCEKTEDKPLKSRLRTRQIKVYSEEDDLHVQNELPCKKIKREPKNLKKSIQSDDGASKVKSQLKSMNDDAKPRVKGKLDMNELFAFACEKCGQRFKHMGWLHRHEQKHKKINASLWKGMKGNKWQDQEGMFDDDDDDDVELMVDEDLNMPDVGNTDDINLEPVVITPRSSKTGQSVIVVGDEEDVPQWKKHLEARNYASRKSSAAPIRDLPPVAASSSFCNICSHHFSSEEDQSEHECSVLSCDKCSRVFKSQDGLNRHHELHVSDAPDKIYDCETCGRVFKQKSHLLLHSRHNHQLEKLPVLSTMPPKRQEIGQHTSQARRKKAKRALLKSQQQAMDELNRRSAWESTMSTIVKDEKLKEERDEAESVITQELKGDVKQEVDGEIDSVTAQELKVVIKQEVDDVNATVSAESFKQENDECVEAVLAPIELNGDIKQEIFNYFESAMAAQEPQEGVEGEVVDIKSAVILQGPAYQVQEKSKEDQVQTSGRVKRRKIPSILQRKRKAVDEPVNELPDQCSRCSLVHPGSHPPPSNFTCQYCNEGFRDVASLDVHTCVRTDETCVRRVVMPEGTVYACTNCTRTFKRRGDLIMHSRRHHGVEILFF